MRASIMLGLALVAVACTEKVETPAAAIASPPLSAATLDSVKAVDAAFAAAMNAKDTASVLAVYADETHFMPPDSPVLDKAGTRTLVEGFLAGGASEFVLTPTTAYGTGDLAYIVGTVSFKMNGVAETDKYAEVLRRGTDGKWRYVVDMFNSIAPPPAPATKK
ncbi:MAG: nuclear transport factor 2 family protein [Gemmatimonadaceae bacterium]